ncbi:MAG TPA: cell envelope integrity protein TolA [Steroidobacteraceae bacterium]|nr:cell envelope integrity protein TolA [Steroidobacteraceae bacterium]
MTRPARGRAAPWVGSVALHLVFVALLAAAALRWRSDPPPEQLAVEGNVVRYEDLPDSVKSGKPLQEKPEPLPQVPPPPEPVPVQPEPEPLPPQPQPEPVDAVAQAQAAAEAQRLEQERIALEQRRAEEQRAAELKRTQDAEAQRRKAAEEQQRAAKAEEERRQAEQRKQQEALAAKQKQAEQEKAAREAKLRAEREADLQRALASEEEGEAFARSGVVDEYRSLLTQTIERNWNRPPSARAGLKCTLYVTQAPGGTVTEVRIGECNGDEAVRESIANAVYRSSPLPAPRDPRAFQRQLVMNFEPKE